MKIVNQSKIEKFKPKKKTDYREEYFVSNFGIPMHEFLSQVKDCRERNVEVEVKGFGYNATNLGKLKTEEHQIVKDNRERRPDFLHRLSLEKRFHRHQMVSKKHEKQIV